MLGASVALLFGKSLRPNNSTSQTWWTTVWRLLISCECLVWSCQGALVHVEIQSALSRIVRFVDSESQPEVCVCVCVMDNSVALDCVRVLLGLRWRIVLLALLCEIVGVGFVLLAIQTVNFEKCVCVC